MKVKKSIFMIAVLMSFMLALISLTGCQGRPDSIDIEGFVAAAEYRGYTVTTADGWTRADINSNAFVEIRQFETANDAQIAFNNIMSHFRSFSGSTVDMPDYQMRRITSGGHFIRIYRLYDIVLFARDATGSRGYLDAFVDIIVIRY